MTTEKKTLKIDLDRPLTDYLGNEAKEGGVPVTLGQMTGFVLDRAQAKDNPIRRGQLAMKLAQGQEQEISVEEAALVRQTVGQAAGVGLTASVLAQIHDAFGGSDA